MLLYLVFIAFGAAVVTGDCGTSNDILGCRDNPDRCAWCIDDDVCQPFRTCWTQPCEYFIPNTATGLNGCIVKPEFLTWTFIALAGVFIATCFVVVVLIMRLRRSLEEKQRSQATTMFACCSWLSLIFGTVIVIAIMSTVLATTSSDFYWILPWLAWTVIVVAVYAGVKYVDSHKAPSCCYRQPQPPDEDSPLFEL